jgi:hypothetical protein
MLRRLVICSAALLIFSIPSAEAQQENQTQDRGGGQRGGGRRQWGGGGGGFRRGGMGGGGALGILGMEKVRKELKISDEQRKQISRLQAESREAMREAFSSSGGGRGGPGGSGGEGEDPFAAMRKKMGEINAKSEKKIPEILKPEQIKRLDQLRIQREGVRSLLRPEVAKKLGLSAEQDSKIKELLPTAFGGRGRWGRGGGRQGGGRPSWQEMQEQRQKQEAQALAVLTKDQTASFDKMKGEKFEFPPPQWGGGRRGGGGGDRPNRPQRPQRPQRPS